ncbi:MAG: RagB/SusD family nutrient uptake outer membrane protein [Porphyromonas sp.]|nr:RagB/SusD family nutrient uptake outer membrane protein [Porphyromonas sp.]
MRRYISTLFLIAILLSGCDNFLYVEPTNQVAITSFDDVRALMGAHLKDLKGMPGSKFGGAAVPFVKDPARLILTYYSGDIDLKTYMDTYIGSNNRSDVNLSLQWQHTSVHTRTWSRLYNNIGYYNMVLEELGKYPSDEQALTEQVSGEARVLRAWTFFQLVTLFVPYGEAEYGLPLNTAPETVSDYDSSRPHQSKNYEFIISELTEVLDYKGAFDPDYSLFYDKHIIHTILAQVYLYKGGSAAGEAQDYEQAVKHARAALESGVSYAVFNRHLIEPQPGYYRNSGFALYDLVESGFEHQDLQGNMWAPVYPSAELLALYGDNDLRKSVYFDPMGNYAITKLETNTIYYGDEYVLFSGAELKLIIAESLARLGKEQEAEQELREFAKSRYEAGTEPPYGNEPILTSILKERQKEFILDGVMSWVDKARTGATITHPALDKEDGSTYTITKGDFRYTLPIPRNGELEYNKIPQNPGWGSF